MIVFVDRAKINPRNFICLRNIHPTEIDKTHTQCGDTHTHTQYSVEYMKMFT